MNWWMLAAAAAPPLAYLGATFRNRGFVCQPHVVMSCTPTRFESRLRATGGPEAVRTGVRIDLGFIVALTVPSGLVLLMSSRPILVLVAVAAATVDLIEDRLLLHALSRPDATTLKWLGATAVVKYAAYLGLVAAVGWAICRD